MAFVVARRDTTTPADKPRVWLYYTGTGWALESVKAQAHPTRAAAIAVHAAVLKAQPWAPGGNPVVVERN